MFGQDPGFFISIFKAFPCPALLLSPEPPDFQILEANDAFCKTTGRSRVELVGQKMFDAFPDNPHDNQATGVTDLRASLIAAIETKRLQELKGQRYSIRQEGAENYELRYWNVTNVPVADASGRLTCIINTAEDVTEEHLLTLRANEAERSSQESLRNLMTVREEKVAAEASSAVMHAIIDTAQAAIFHLLPVYDRQGILTDFRFSVANKMLAAYVGQTPEAVIGTLGSKWFPSYKTNGLFDRYSHTFLTGTLNRFEFHYDADGIDVWLDIMSTQVDDGVLVTFTDFTAMKNLQRRLEEHVAELSSSNTNLEQFAYVASHDLQEPLRKVKSFGDMLQGRYSEMLGPAGADLIARMQSATGRMGTLIEDLLAYSRASAKPAEMQIIDTTKVLQAALIDLERVIAQKKASIKWDHLLPVAGQTTQLGQVFLNLLSNALKFCPPDRAPEIRITSSTIKGKNAPVAVAGRDRERQFQLIQITDNGIGFDITYRERIFQIFQRLHNRSEYPGSGVGLSIVRKVVENHGGYIDASSEPGNGATFSILLPLINEDA